MCNMYVSWVTVVFNEKQRSSVDFSSVKLINLEKYSFPILNAKHF